MAQDAREWLSIVGAAMLRGDVASALARVSQALTAFPESRDLRRAQAGIFIKARRSVEAESLLRALLATDATDIASAFTLSELLAGQDHAAAAGGVLRDCFESGVDDPELAIRAIELLDAWERKSDAAAIARQAVARHPDDARLHAYAGMLAIQMGEFKHAREHYLVALDHDTRAVEWRVPLGLTSTQRYTIGTHPDVTRFKAELQRADLTQRARAELHFALGKVFDDVGDYAQAAHHLEHGNAIRHALSPWSPKAWRRFVTARLSSQPATNTAKLIPAFTPIFIVGLPRTGTTLLAELLSRHAGVCNRGELPWLARMAEDPALNGSPSMAALQDAAGRYALHVRQDDATSSCWFIDKQPLNFRYVDLALAMFPNAKVIHCRRNPRDTALSLWKQCFLEQVQDYSYDFADMVIVMRDEQRLMAHWRKLFPTAIRTIRYEALVASPTEIAAELATWVGVPSATTQLAGDPSHAISTASLWQARQPVHANSVDRWRRYAPHVPGLSLIPEI